MFGLLQRTAPKQAAKARRVPAGVRVYAIGDIHGCLAEFEDLLDTIAEDCEGSGLECKVVLLGDLVDRGPDSAGVVERAMAGPLPGTSQSFIAGNHEEAMIEVWEGNTEALSGWLRFGGIQTLQSYGIGRAEVFRLGIDLPRMMREVVPKSHIDFLKSFEDQVRIGDYLFVHAGIRPGVPLDQQERFDLRWIREEFLSDEQSDHGVIVVHGHTISENPEIRSNRIGIDTGCYSSGRLTALVLEGDERRFIATGKAPARAS